MRIRSMLFCVALALVLGGCAPRTGDYFAPFQGAYAAQIEGTWQGMTFAAHLTASAPNTDGSREMTLTFYAPSSLSGTVLAKDASGALTLGTDGFSLPLDGTAAKGYDALFALFPTAAQVQRVAKENGNVRLFGANFSLLLASDGTPLAAENAQARVQVLRFTANFQER